MTPLEVEQGEPRPVVRCILANEEKITARACIDTQTARRCFCPRAAFAINEIAPLTVIGTPLRERIEESRARARAAMSSGGYLGAALDVHRGVAVEAPPMFAGELPPPPNVERQAITVEDLQRAEAVALGRPLPPPEPAAAARAAPASPPSSLPEQPPAPPAKERSPMATSKLHQLADEDVRAMFRKHNRQIKGAAEEMKVDKSTLRRRLVRLGEITEKAGSKKPGEPRKALRAAAEAAPPKSDPVVYRAVANDDELVAIADVLGAISTLSAAARTYVAARIGSAAP